MSGAELPGRGAAGTGVWGRAAAASAAAAGSLTRATGGGARGSGWQAVHRCGYLPRVDARWGTEGGGSATGCAVPIGPGGSRDRPRSFIL